MSGIRLTSTLSTNFIHMMHHLLTCALLFFMDCLRSTEGGIKPHVGFNYSGYLLNSQWKWSQTYAGNPISRCRTIVDYSTVDFKLNELTITINRQKDLWGICLHGFLPMVCVSWSAASALCWCTLMLPLPKSHSQSGEKTTSWKSLTNYCLTIMHWIFSWRNSSIRML